MAPTRRLVQHWSGAWRQQKQKLDFAHSRKPDPYSNRCCGGKFQATGGPGTERPVCYCRENAQERERRPLAVPKAADGGLK